MRIVKSAMLLAALVVPAGAATLPPNPPPYSVVLTWQAPTNSLNPITSYNIYSRLDPAGSFSLAGSVSVDLTTYTDTNILEGNTYDYYVKSANDQGNESSPSNTVSLSIPFVPFAPVVGTPTVE